MLTFTCCSRKISLRPLSTEGCAASSPALRLRRLLSEERRLLSELSALRMLLTICAFWVMSASRIGVSEGWLSPMLSRARL